MHPIPDGMMAGLLEQEQAISNLKKRKRLLTPSLAGRTVQSYGSASLQISIAMKDVIAFHLCPLVASSSQSTELFLFILLTKSDMALYKSPIVGTKKVRLGASTCVSALSSELVGILLETAAMLGPDYIVDRQEVRAGPWRAWHSLVGLRSGRGSVVVLMVVAVTSSVTAGCEEIVQRRFSNAFVFMKFLLHNERGLPLLAGRSCGAEGPIMITVSLQGLLPLINTTMMTSYTTIHICGHYCHCQAAILICSTVEQRVCTPVPPPTSKRHIGFITATGDVLIGR